MTHEDQASPFPPEQSSQSVRQPIFNVLRRGDLYALSKIVAVENFSDRKATLTTSVHVRTKSRRTRTPAPMFFSNLVLTEPRASESGGESISQQYRPGSDHEQCGLFVGAESYTAQICPALFTHYKPEEDKTMKSGKFDEELSRMSDIADHVIANSILLFNESFAATNDREGSDIARQIARALLEKGTKVFYVTHLYEFARRFFAEKIGNALSCVRSGVLTAEEPLG